MKFFIILNMTLLTLISTAAFGQTAIIECNGTLELKGSYSCEDNDSGMPYVSSAGFSRKIPISFSKNVKLEPYVQSWWWKAEMEVPVSAVERKMLYDEIKEELGTQNRRCHIEVSEYKTYVDLEYDSRTRSFIDFRVDGSRKVLSEGKNAGLFHAGLGSILGALHCSVKVAK